MTSIDSTTTQRLLRDCRELLEHDMADLMDELGPVIAEEVAKLVESTRDEARKAEYLTLLHDLQQRWPTFTTACVDTLSDLLQARKAASAGDSGGELQLVSDQELAEQIVLREFIGRVSEACSEEIFALDRRIGHLQGRADGEPVDNPFSPELVCTAIRSGCGAMYPEVGRYSLLLRQLERHLRLELPALYRSINEVLVDAGILPNLKRSYRPTRSGEANKATEPEQVMSALQRLAKNRGGSSSGHGSGASGAAGDGGPLVSVAISPALFDSLKALESAPAANGEGLKNIVHMARDSDAARHVPPLEAITLDIVATLFDLIFDDPKIPNSIKGLVSRLQIPILKLAMLDQKFFGDRSHPARRFLDSISGLTLRWGKTVNETDPFYLKLAQLVDRIHFGFDTDADIFGTAIAELAEFVTRHEAVEADAANSVAEILLRKEEEDRLTEERRVAARTLAEAALAPLVAQAPASIAPFLREMWREVLVRQLVQAGPGASLETPACQVAVRIAEELLWSLSPKRTADERKRQTALLPKLLAGLNQGLDQIDADKDTRSHFMDDLMAMQLAALQGGKTAAGARTPGASPAPATDPPKPAPIELQVARSVENGVRIEQMKLADRGQPVERKALDRGSLRRVKHLTRGDWVDFIDESGENRRERLTWISPNRSLYVFSNHAANCALSITPEALAHRLQTGSAVLIEIDAPMFERALDGAIKALDKPA